MPQFLTIRTKFLPLLLMLSIGLLSGCATSSPGLYYWGSYQEQVYTQYSKPDKATPERQIAALERDIQKAKAANKPLPPGFYAHLAYQYLVTGNKTKATEYLMLEKQIFPESTVYVDLMLKHAS